jgi:hypothetical protein
MPMSNHSTNKKSIVITKDLVIEESKVFGNDEICNLDRMGTDEQ